MSGDIWVTSKVGVGSIFYFTVVVRLAEPSLAIAEQIIPYRNRRILFFNKGMNTVHEIPGMLTELGLEPLLVNSEERVVSQIPGSMGLYLRYNTR